jgi:hypothetical protein
MPYPPPNLRRLLPEPSRVKSFRTVIDLSDIFEVFYFGIGALHSEVEGSFTDILLSLEPEQLITMAIHSIELTITRGSYNSGITYRDIADLTRHPQVRQAIYAGELEDNFSQLYTPPISNTQQYHLDTLESALTEAITETFGNATRTGVKQEDDVILWRTLVSLVVEIAKAVSYGGYERGISEHALMSYSFTEPQRYGQDVAYNQYVFILSLNGP